MRRCAGEEDEEMCSGGGGGMLGGGGGGYGEVEGGNKLSLGKVQTNS